MNPIRLTQGLTLVGQFGLITALVLWFGLLAPSTIFGPWLAAVWAGPLLLPLPGLIRGRSYTYAWNSLLLMLYIALGITEVLSNPPEQMYALAVVLLAVMTFISSQLYVRGRGSLTRVAKTSTKDKPDSED